jgi:hypothetical protein
LEDSDISCETTLGILALLFGHDLRFLGMGLLLGFSADKWIDDGMDSFLWLVEPLIPFGMRKTLMTWG